VGVQKLKDTIGYNLAGMGHIQVKTEMPAEYFSFVYAD
jgi:hypothetical protein